MDSIKLTEKEFEAMEDFTVCSRATKKLVEEAVKHFELSDKLQREWWRNIAKKHGLDLYENHYEYNAQTKTVNFLGTVGEARILEKLKSQLDSNKVLRKECIKLMGHE